MCEAGVNVKVIQDTLGHKDISTTLNIYTDVTKELRQSEFEGLDSYFKSEYANLNIPDRTKDNRYCAWSLCCCFFVFY